MIRWTTSLEGISPQFRIRELRERGEKFVKVAFKPSRTVSINIDSKTETSDNL
jgi:hypothetical protein